MHEPRAFFVTTPIYYVNDRPHLGHVYTTALADVVARFRRLTGADTFFLTGVDEHSTKVVEKAREHGFTPAEWADRHAASFREVFEKLEMSHDDFVRTSSARHRERVTRYVEALLESGDVYEGKFEGWYDAGQEEYVPEHKAGELDYRSPVNGRPLVRKTERNYFFRLSAYRAQLADFYERRDAAGSPFVRPAARRNEILNRIHEAEDVPITRTGTEGWGIPVPGDPEQTIYVWIDALFNYLTYVDEAARRHYWEAGPVHFIAKDILWFHAAIWPALLMALSRCPGYAWVYDEPVRAAHVVYTHSYWVSESGEKMSKSLGNFLDPEAIDNYVAEFGLDPLRYFLATRGPQGVSDATFSPDLFAEVYNADLANTFGNACSRVTRMIGRYFEGLAPEAAAEASKGVEGAERPWPEIAAEATGRWRAHFEALALHDAAAEALGLVRHVDEYIDATEPFRLAKAMEANRGEVATILYHCAEALRIASILLWPFLPQRCAEALRRLGTPEVAGDLAGGGGRDVRPALDWGGLIPGTPIAGGDPLFPRYEAVKG